MLVAMSGANRARIWSRVLRRVLNVIPATTAKQQRTTQITRLRREAITSPVLFVGTGTCGLGAGAGKTLEALKNCLSGRGIAGGYC